ncbi:glycoside hydrolase family 78 protein [Kineosporia sp. NBRC 101731]|uniref:glycoside hydrolase family 78 protein n=1 Tax=Kineosporia sp. NBRC 101731 TaxID=3032199 RepID=UPI0024A11327|nr:glycoside hydrolase family 78 protein [Kineosporia sp. NBRC 101731]GLY29745.1 alpha-L-rhamnosidase [Kineosporia sp. NBRC 101731]
MAPRPSAPTVEHLSEPLGIGTATPRLGWTTQAEPAWRQAAYELQIERGRQTGHFTVAGADQVLVPWPDAPLASREQAHVRVRVTGEDGSVSPWSPATVLEAGLLHALDWSAAGVRPGWTEDASDSERRPPQFRRGFSLPAAVTRARLYVTAHGVYEVEINGSRVGREALNPGWTVYQQRLRYHTYDITDQLREGENAIGAWMGDGWWRGRYGFHGGTLNIYGTDIALLAQLEIDLADGTSLRIGTDADWSAHPSPVLHSSLYVGETYDAAALSPGWSSPGFDDSAWKPVAIAEFATGTLVAPDGPPVRCTEDLRPVSVGRTGPDTLLVDFGQNFAGRVHLAADRGVDPELSIHHAELLQDGALFTRNLRGATSVDRYLGSDGSIDWEPRFTIHGFRYAEIRGYRGEIDQLRITGRVYHSDMRRTGWLETSHDGLNRLHENVRWSMRSNFVDVPTDCPQRDERLGWTGDLQVFAPTGSYLYDLSGFVTSWLRDVEVEQQRFGTVPWYVPVIPGAPQWTPINPGAVWGDVAVLTPWTLYERFGDTGVLENQYASARAWVDQVERLAGPSRLWNSGMQLGDWLDPAAPPEDPTLALTDPYLVATAYFAWSAQRLSQTAAVLGRGDDAERYGRLAREVRTAFGAEWGRSDGLLTNGTQTGYALAIAFDLLDDPERAGAELAALVRARGNRVGAGFAGVNLVADALSRTGQLETAFDLLLEERTPSWLSMVGKGATTMWERWDSLLDDGTVNPGEMNSFNHYALGSIADWMHRVIGGIEPLEPGYRRIRFAPVPGGDLTGARARHDSPYGTIECVWTRVDGSLDVSVTLPIGTTGVVEVAGLQRREVGPGTHLFTIPQ